MKCKYIHQIGSLCNGVTYNVLTKIGINNFFLIRLLNTVHISKLQIVLYYKCKQRTRSNFPLHRVWKLKNFSFTQIYVKSTFTKIITQIPL